MYMNPHVLGNIYSYQAFFHHSPLYGTSSDTMRLLKTVSLEGKSSMGMSS